MEASDDVQVQVLGPLRLLIDGRAVELGPERRRSVLAALIVDLGRTVPVDQLADRVWNGDPPAAATPSVHAYVSRLRSSMRRFAEDGAELPPVIITQAPGYRIAVDPQAVDALRMTDLLDQAQQRYAAGGHQDLVAAATSLRTALALWQDEPYLDIRADFARHEADRLHGVRLVAQELSIRIQLDQGRHEIVLPEIAELASRHPLRESLQAALLLALYRCGRQAEALAELDLLRRRLADELGIDPGPEIRRLQEQILRQDPALDVPTTDRLVVSAPVEPPRSAAAVVSGSRLIGRDAELGTLVGALDRIGTTFSPAAVVGEAGIGKTRLVEEVGSLLADHGVRVGWGRCWQHEGAPVLWPWIQLLETVTDQLTATELARCTAIAGLGALVPRLTEHPQGALSADQTVPETGAGGERVRLYEAVRQLLAVLASDGTRLLLVLEDMHWADEASRELAEYLVGHRTPPPVGLTITVRSPTEDSTRAGTELLDVWSRSGRAVRVDLVGWDTDAVAAYVSDRTGDTLDPSTSAALADRTGGNPFFVGELVRLLVTDVEHSAALPALTQSVPDSIRDVIARRFDRLSPDDRAVLQTAAVVGRTFDLELLEAAAGRDADTVDEAIDRATELGIISTDPDAVGRHRFVHALTQQTLLDLTGPARRRRLHDRVATVLSKRRADAELTAVETEQLTYHLTRTGARADLERAVDHTLVGSDRALQRGNFPEAESLLLQALGFCARLGEEGRRETATRLRLWSLYTLVGGPGTPAAAGQHERALELVRRYGGAAEIMTAHQAVLSQMSWFSDLTGLDRLVEEMSEAAEAADDDLMRAAAISAAAEVHTNRGQLDTALRAFARLDDYRKVIRHAPAGVFPLQLDARVAAWHAIALTAAGQTEKADRSARRAESALTGALPTSAAYVRMLLVCRTMLLDDPAEALRLAEVAHEIATRHDLVEGGDFVSVQLSWAQERLRPGSGREAMATILDRSLTVPARGHRPGLWSLLADVQLRAGDRQRARATIERARHEAAVTGEALYLPRIERLARSIG